MDPEAFGALTASEVDNSETWQTVLNSEIGTSSEPRATTAQVHVERLGSGILQFDVLVARPPYVGPISVDCESCETPESMTLDVRNSFAQEFPGRNAVVRFPDLETLVCRTCGLRVWNGPGFQWVSVGDIMTAIIVKLSETGGNGHLPMHFGLELAA